MAFGEKEFYELFHKPEVLPYIVGCAGLEPCRKLSAGEMKAISDAAAEAAAKDSQDAADRAEQALNMVKTILDDVRRAVSIANVAQDTAERALALVETGVAEAVAAAKKAAEEAKLSREALDRALELIKAFACCSRPNVRDVYNVNTKDGCGCFDTSCCENCSAAGTVDTVNCNGNCGVTVVPDDDTSQNVVVTGCGCGNGQGLNITYTEPTYSPITTTDSNNTNSTVNNLASSTGGV